MKLPLVKVFKRDSNIFVRRLSIKSTKTLSLIPELNDVIIRMSEDELNIIPENIDSGSDGTQSSSNEQISLHHDKIKNVGGLDNYPVSMSVQGIYDTGVRGQSAMTLLICMIQNLERQLIQEKADKKTLQFDLDKMKEKYYDEREKSAIIYEKLSVQDKNKAIGNILTTLGGIVLGITFSVTGVDYSVVWPILTSFLGLALIVIGWILSLNKNRAK